MKYTQRDVDCCSVMLMTDWVHCLLKLLYFWYCSCWLHIGARWWILEVMELFGEVHKFLHGHVWCMHWYLSLAVTTGWQRNKCLHDFTILHMVMEYSSHFGCQIETELKVVRWCEPLIHLCLGLCSWFPYTYLVCYQNLYPAINVNHSTVEATCQVVVQQSRWLFWFVFVILTVVKLTSCLFIDS